MQQAVSVERDHRPPASAPQHVGAAYEVVDDGAPALVVERARHATGGHLGDRRRRDRSILRPERSGSTRVIERDDHVVTSGRQKPREGVVVDDGREGVATTNGVDGDAGQATNEHEASVAAVSPSTTPARA